MLLNHPDDLYLGAELDIVRLKVVRTAVRGVHLAHAERLLAILQFLFIDGEVVDVSVSR